MLIDSHCHLNYKGCRELNYTRVGSYQWSQAFNGMVSDERIFVFEEPGGRGQNKKMVGLRKHEDE